MGPHRDDAAQGAATPGSLMSPADLDRVRQRDPEALGRLFDAYFGRLYGLAFRLMGQQAAAEEVVQEVFLRVHKAAHQLDVGRDPAPWLLTITTNLCREKWRSRQGRQDQQTLSLDARPEFTANVAAVGATPEQAAERADDERLLGEALARLPEAMRLVVVLHDLQGQTHEEIAILTEEEPPAVRKRYSRALGRLRELLKDHKPDVLA
jgi:RNA polymerase sigma-70 factor (ECF subfamily)